MRDLFLSLLLIVLFTSCSKNVSEPQRDIKELAFQGDSKAQYELGNRMSYIQNSEYNKEAIFWLEKSANQGYGKSIDKLGDMYYNGKVIGNNEKESLEKAIYWYEKAIEQGIVRQCVNCYEYAKEKKAKIEKNEKEEKALFEKFTIEANKGDLSSQHNLGILYVKKEDYTKAIEWYEKAANKGYPESQYNLGTMYDEGKGVKQDYKKAAEWYEKAAKNGLALAQYNLGYMYAMGQGVELNKIKAYDYWIKSAKQGHSKAQNNLDILCKESPWACK